MTFEEYKKFAALAHDPAMEKLGDKKILLFALGLGCETGEVEQLINKGAGYEKGVAREDLIKELGDVMWNFANICNFYDLTLETILETNARKLKERYPTHYNIVQPSAAQASTVEKRSIVCPKCTHGTGVVVQNGPHLQLKCEMCGFHIKFLKKGEVEHEDLPWFD